MKNQLDGQMKVSLVCAALIICCVVEMFFTMISYIIYGSSSYGGNGLGVAILFTIVVALTLPCVYHILNGSKRAWIIAFILCAISVVTSIIFLSQEIIYIVIVISDIVACILLLLPFVRQHCGINLKRHIDELA